VLKILVVKIGNNIFLNNFPEFMKINNHSCPGIHFALNCNIQDKIMPVGPVALLKQLFILLVCQGGIKKPVGGAESKTLCYPQPLPSKFI
jgi:hypothetical protein